MICRPDQSGLASETRSMGEGRGLGREADLGRDEGDDICPTPSRLEPLHEEGFQGVQFLTTEMP